MVLLGFSHARWNFVDSMDNNGFLVSYASHNVNFGDDIFVSRGLLSDDFSSALAVRHSHPPARFRSIRGYAPATPRTSPTAIRQDQIHPNWPQGRSPLEGIIIGAESPDQTRTLASIDYRYGSIRFIQPEATKMTHQIDVRELTQLLALEHTPIGISRVAAEPPGVARAGRDLPSACAYWREGEKRMVYATAADHGNCPIGMMVMGSEPPPEIANEAQILVGNMAELGYLDPSEVAHLPMLSGEHAGHSLWPRRGIRGMSGSGPADSAVRSRR